MSTQPQEPAQQGAQQAIDQRIKLAQRKGIGMYLLSGFATLVVLVGFLLWLFLVRGFNVLIGPVEALPSAQLRLVSGIAWVTENKIYSLGGTIVVSASADTFETKQVSIDNLSPSTIEIVLNPSPAQINAKVSLNGASQDEQFATLASQSQWFLNGQLINIGQELNHEAPPGTYQLSVKNDYFKGSTQALNVKRAEVLALDFDLQTISGSITLQSQPAGAEVYLNNQLVGNTPYTIDLTGGIFPIRIESLAYQTVEESIEITTGYLTPNRNYQLAPKLAELSISATPSTGLLLINNVEYTLGTHRLAANKKHLINYQKDGYTNYTKTLDLSIEKPTSLAIELQQQFGNVEFETNVPALVKVNQQNIGPAPFKQRLPSVEHTFEFSAQGYRSVKRTLTPRPNQTLKQVINLQTEFDARRSEGRPLVANQMGINLLRFRADAFTMGSAPNETGRRRNEHQVEVDFARQFWVSDKEITQAQFAAFSGTSGNSSTLPITGISWLQAAEFCNWLSIKEGLPVFYRFVNGRYQGYNKDSKGYRLPTEAEWEWLAKKSKRARSTIYVWGNQDTLRDNYGNFADQSRKDEQLIVIPEYSDGKKGLAEVGSFKADRSGLYDLAGNVSEWVHDYYTNAIPDSSGVKMDYMGATRGDSWVIKGGNYESGRIRELRAAFREFSASGKENLGFRIARYQK
ncbi:SUMF1/EgtB/PvdO family nonheme iron enzyme [Glaciecola petra]|uniref:SUMF1/EgtB/PvdO family nonheme iron enzyme n=1 Tax=Glaciecola petra TaxID=3075602 RepID=A0ABU2ZSV8_9ALTE|nr:SUMF1/EgtB/PvdO family nonheme iron enzyme [Aestuariibacter sp. P117]MDT0595724.1 SUMF1/EgtB/PvdO family nonheme iron enzyme [Aestuariibacter sp. P117]